MKLPDGSKVNTTGMNTGIEDEFVNAQLRGFVLKAIRLSSWPEYNIWIDAFEDYFEKCPRKYQTIFVLEISSNLQDWLDEHVSWSASSLDRWIARNSGGFKGPKQPENPADALKYVRYTNCNKIVKYLEEKHISHKRDNPVRQEKDIRNVKPLKTYDAQNLSDDQIRQLYELLVDTRRTNLEVFIKLFRSVPINDIKGKIKFTVSIRDIAYTLQRLKKGYIKEKYYQKIFEMTNCLDKEGNPLSAQQIRGSLNDLNKENTFPQLGYKIHEIIDTPIDRG